MKNASGIKVAIAGYGTMGTIYAKALGKMQGVKLTDICTRNLQAMGNPQDYPGARLFDSYVEMLSSSDAEVVCVTLPTYLHKEYVMLAAAYGKHIICEKPIALNKQDAEEMIDACAKNGVNLFLGHVLRFFPEYQNLHKLVSEGAVGLVGVVHTKRANIYPPKGSWYGDSSKSGGIIMDLMIHDIDFLRWILGEVRSVYAMIRTAESIEYAAVTLRFEHGAIANLEAFWGYPGPFTTSIEIAGNAGVLRNDNQSSRSLILRNVPTPNNRTNSVIVPSSFVYRDPFFEEISHFLDCIRNNQPPIVSALDAYKAVEIATAAAQSASAGMPVLLSHSDLNEGGLAR